MKNIKVVLLNLSALIFVGCTTTSPVNGGLEQQQNASREVITQSLFDSKDRTISEEDIQRLLNGKIIIPDTVRVAVFKYASTSMNRYYSYYWNDEEYLKIQQSYVDTIRKVEFENSGMGRLSNKGWTNGYQKRKPGAIRLAKV